MTTSDCVPTSSAGANGAGGMRHQERDRGQLLGRVRRDRHEAAQHVAGRRHEQRAAEDLADRVEPELEAGDDAEVAAATADRPEQVRVRVLARGDLPPIGGDDLDRDEGVDGQAVLAHQPADPATERQPADADRAGVAERGGKAVSGRGPRVLPGGQAGLRPGETPLRVDVEALHRSEVEDDPALARPVAGQAVAAAADRQLEARIPVPARRSARRRTRPRRGR